MTSAPSPRVTHEIELNPVIQKGNILIYRVFDVAEEIDLSQVENDLIQESGKSRLRISRGSRNALVMRNAPLRINLGEVQFRLLNQTVRAEGFATIWDYGVLSLVFQVPIEPGTRWNELIPSSSALQGEIPGSNDIDELALRKSRELTAMLRTSLKKPNEWTTLEDYVIFFIERITGVESATQLVSQGKIPELILGESSERLALKSRSGILESTFQYSENDLVTIDWNSAVVIEPSGQREIPDTIEFALTHLLEFRYYDDLLDRKLADLYDAVEARSTGIWRSNYARISQEANARFLEFSEFIERIDNSLKVVGDFYLAVIFRASVRRFRIPDWQQSVTRKMNMLARVSQLLHGEINVHRGHALEIIIIALIAFEIVSAIVRK